jgi:hypothetical protein
MKRTESPSILVIMDKENSSSDEELNEEMLIDDHAPAKYQSITKLVNIVTGSGQQFLNNNISTGSQFVN